MRGRPKYLFLFCIGKIGISTRQKIRSFLHTESQPRAAHCVNDTTGFAQEAALYTLQFHLLLAERPKYPLELMSCEC